MNTSLLNLLVEILYTNLSAELYEASICGVYGSIVNLYGSLCIMLEGFHDKLSVLLHAIVDELADLRVPESVFKSVLTELRRGLKVDSCNPETLADDLRDTILTSGSITMVDEMKMLADVTVDHFSTYVRSFLSRFFNEALVYGNLTVVCAEEMFAYFKQRLHPLPLPREPPPFARQLVQLPVGTSFCRVRNLTLGAVNGVVLNYFQIGRETPRRKVMAKILSKIIGQPLFASLRTREQLGYTVSCYDVLERNVVGFVFEIHYEAHKFSAFHVNQRLEVFLRDFFEYLSKMKQKTYEGFILDVFSASISTPVNMIDAAAEVWNEISSKQYKFGRSFDEAGIAISLSKKRLIEFATKIFVADDKKEKNANNQISKRVFNVHKSHPIRHSSGVNTKAVATLGRRVKLPHQPTLTERLVRAHRQIEDMNAPTKMMADHERNSTNNNNQASVANFSTHSSKTTSSSASAMSRRKLSVHVLGYGPLEDQSMRRCVPSTPVSDHAEEDSVVRGGEGEGGEFRLEFVPSQSLFPKSQHILDIESFRAKLYAYPLETAAP